MLYVGDCVALMKKMDSGSVDLAIVDPPYNVNYEYDMYSDNKTPADYMKWSHEWFHEVHRLTGAMWLIIGDDYVSELDMMIKASGMIRRNWCFWYYTFGPNQRRRFTPSHTHLLYYVKDSKKFTWNMDAVAVPSARQTKYNDIRAAAGGKVPDDTWALNPGTTEDVWNESRICGTFKERTAHSAQLSRKIVERMILATSNVGDMVLDPMTGSGTVPAVATQLGRRFVGMELSWAYARIAERRCLGKIEIIE